MKDSKIEWTTHTFNPWWGCAKVSPGCTHCYAESLSKRYGRAEWGIGGTRPVASDTYWKQPLKWNREAQGAPDRPRVFCASMADVFEDRPDLVDPRARLAVLVRATPNLDWLLLTKRPENMTRLWPADWTPNIWAGTTTEDQQRAEERIPHLLKVPARVRFLSVEPQVGPVDLRQWLMPLHPDDQPGRIDWVIQGGESGAGARPFYTSWARDLRDQCKAAGVAYHLKQLGKYVVTRNDDGWDGEEPDDWPEGGTVTTDEDVGGYQGAPVRVWLGDPKGGDWSKWPEDLRVRQYPTPLAARTGESA